MDIFNISRSKTREAILALYFSYPEKKYYLRQLEKMLHFPVQNIRRELINLEKNSIFKREKSGNQVFYFLNRKSPIYSDIRNIISKTIGIENQIRESLSGISGINKAFIFGSFADGTQNSLSDIDIIITGDIDEDVLIEKISRLENKFEREINYHIYGEKEFRERRNEENSFISKILSKPVIFLIGENENNTRIH
ncbi:MAG: nucleotidyltransferase domain-containing protein [Actinobacteria bacterium]|nr:nucleotidyltransferase domain-containing protein [Actinomycetota bacterium]